MLHTNKSRRAIAIFITITGIVLFGQENLLTQPSDGKTDTPVFTGKEDHHITLTEASQLTFNFRMQAGPNTILGGFFGKDAVMAILNQDNAAGLRYYYGLDENGKPHLILIGVDAKGNDMTDGLLAQRSVVCPPICAVDNELNSPAPENQVTSTRK